MDPWTSWNLDLRARERTQRARMFRAPTCTMRIRPHTSVCVYVCSHMCVLYVRDTRTVQRATNRPSTRTPERLEDERE